MGPTRGVAVWRDLKGFETSSTGKGGGAGRVNSSKKKKIRSNQSARKSRLLIRVELGCLFSVSVYDEEPGVGSPCALTVGSGRVKKSTSISPVFEPRDAM